MSENAAWAVGVTCTALLCAGLMLLSDRCDQREVACTAAAYSKCVDARQSECIAAAQRVCGRGVSR